MVIVMQNVIFCKIGWMKKYEGITNGDKIENGGKYVDENGIGHEIYNFSPINDKYYGYVRTPKGSNLNLERIKQNSNGNEYVDNVLVIWVATNPKGGVYVVGWYNNARVFKMYQNHSQKIINSFKEKLGEKYPSDGDFGYIFEAKIEDCILLDEKDRKLKAPKGISGQSPIWYGDCKEDSTCQQVKEKIFNLVDEINKNQFIENENLSAEDIERIIKTRKYQDKFRKNVLTNFNSKCCITGISEKKLLIASHIIPWSKNKEKRLDSANGLCLFVLYDALFDKGYFSLTDDLKIIVSKDKDYDDKLKKILDSIGGKSISKPVEKDIDIKYIKYHRKHIFKG